MLVLRARAPEMVLSRLGAHPEVGVCPGCVRSLQRRVTAKRDAHRRTPGGCAGVHAVRAAVLHRGWQDRGVLGTVLRRVDRHLP